MKIDQKPNERARAYREANRDKVKAYNLAYYAANRAKRCADSKARYHANTERVLSNNRSWREANKERQRWRELARKYNLTEAQWRGILEKQGFACAICDAAAPGGKRGWQTDHCHEIGVVRGLLCLNCNTGLGAFKDNPDTLRRAIAYLAKSR